MKINIKNLCKQIKKDGKRTLYWTCENGINYICNRHYAVKYKDIPREVLVALFSVFAKKFHKKDRRLKRTIGMMIHSFVRKSLKSNQSLKNVKITNLLNVQESSHNTKIGVIGLSKLMNRL